MASISPTSNCAAGPHLKRLRTAEYDHTAADAMPSNMIALVCPADEEAMALGERGEKSVIVVHRAALDVSPTLAMYLQHESVEAQRRRIDIADVTADTMQVAVNYMYAVGLGASPINRSQDAPGSDEAKAAATCQRLFAEQFIPAKDALLVLVCGAKYQLQGLKASAERQLLANMDDIDDEDLLTVHRCATTCDAPNLLAACHKAIFIRLRLTFGHDIDKVRLLKLLRGLTDSKASEILKAFPRYFSVWLEEVFRGYCHQCDHPVYGADYCRIKSSVCSMEKPKKLSRERALMDLITGLFEAESGLPVAGSMITTMFRRSHVSYFLLSPRATLVFNRLTQGVLAKHAERGRVVNEIRDRPIDISVKLISVIDENGLVVQPYSFRREFRGPSETHELYDKDGAWYSTWADKTITTQRSKIGSASCAFSAALSALKAYPGVAGKNYRGDFISQGYFAGVECKDKDKDERAVVHVVLGSVRHVLLEDLLDLAGYDILDPENYPPALKLILIDGTALQNAEYEGRKLTNCIKGFRFGGPTSAWKWWDPVDFPDDIPFYPSQADELLTNFYPW